ncbi:hypothetical protein BDR07DRAFT_413690 [Suillus spraguei]|nr:hypothetical protein BDR07DRAFT_413690 [Suillus spraguei]
MSRPMSELFPFLFIIDYVTVNTLNLNSQSLHCNCQIIKYYCNDCVTCRQFSHPFLQQHQCLLPHNDPHTTKSTISYTTNMDHNGSTILASSKHLALLNTSSPPTAASSLPSPPYSPPPPASRSTPPTRGASPTDATKALKAARRQSSISYVSSRVDVFSRHGTSTSPTMADASIGIDTVHGTAGLSEGHQRTSRSMKRRTIVGLEELRRVNTAGGARARMSVGNASAERTALTLAEK